MEDAIGKIPFFLKKKLFSRLNNMMDSKDSNYFVGFFILDAANDAAAQAEESKDPNRLLRLS